MADRYPRTVCLGGRTCHVTHLLVKASGRISEEAGRFAINSGRASLATLRLETKGERKRGKNKRKGIKIKSSVYLISNKKGRKIERERI